MKVTIGKYKPYRGLHWLSTKIFFWKSRDSDFHYDIAERLDKFSWVEKFLDWLDGKRKRKVKIHIDPWDTWNMDHTLALIIVPMLKQLRDTGHTHISMELKDVPPSIRDFDFSSYDETKEPTPEDYVFSDEITAYFFREVIFAFQYIIDDDMEFDFVKEHRDRANHGLILFGKYFRSLWD